MKQKGKFTQRMREFKTPLLVGLIFVVWIASWGWQKWQYRKTIDALTSLSPEQVTMFRIYPRAAIPVDTSLEFTPPDSIITDFFQALTDQRPYSYSHDTVASPDHDWFLEVTAGEVFIQISFHIPYDTDNNIVAGHLGKYRKRWDSFYGYFQSQQLYDWYQQHSHRWLTQNAPG